MIRAMATRRRSARTTVAHAESEVLPRGSWWHAWMNRWPRLHTHDARHSGSASDAQTTDKTDWPATVQTQPSTAWLETSAQERSAQSAFERAKYVVSADQHLSQEASPADRSRDAAHRMVWRDQLWQQIEWKRQLTVIIGLFRQVGFKTHWQHAVGFTGGDVLLTTGRDRLLLRCLAARAPVARADIQDFLRQLQARGYVSGTYVTTGHFTEAARMLAREHRVHTLDGQQLLALIRRRTEDQQALLWAAAHQGAYWRPTCIRCDVKLAPSVRANDRRPVWMCRHTPGCPVLLPMDLRQLSRTSEHSTAPEPTAADRAYAITQPLPLNDSLMPST